MKQSLETFIDEVRGTTTPASLWQLGLDFFHAQGVARVSYHHFMLGDADGMTIFTDGFPVDWVCRYIEEELYRIDPIPELARRMAHGFRWSEVASLAALHDEQRAFLEQLDFAELGDGLAIPVFGPRMRNGYVGLGFGKDGKVPNAAEAASFQMAAQAAHLRYCEMLDEISPEPARLSKREREILDWIARGKSNAVIAEILQISRHTVDTHVRRIYEKLNVADRTSAAIIGIGSSLVQPSMRDRVA